MKSINKITILGHITSEPKFKKTINGVDKMQFSVATSEGYKDKNTGEWKNNSDFHFCEIIGERVQYMPTISTGDWVYVEGLQQNREYTKEGNVKDHWRAIRVEDFKLLLSKAEQMIIHPPGTGGYGNKTYPNASPQIPQAQPQTAYQQPQYPQQVQQGQQTQYAQPQRPQPQTPQYQAPQNYPVPPMPQIPNAPPPQQVNQYGHPVINQQPQAQPQQPPQQQTPIIPIYQDGGYDFDPNQ